MNNMERDEILLKEGFTQREVSVIRQHAEKDGYPYPWLLSQLKKRFIGSCVIIFIILIGWLYTAFYGTKESLVSLTITFVACTGIIYVVTPMKPGYKAMRFLRKNIHL